MTPREFRQGQNLEFDHFQELTSTGINPNYVNIDLFANEYHKAKLKLLGIGVVSNCGDIEWHKNRPNGIKTDEWWCPSCMEIVPSFDVTNDERHGIDGCMTKVC